MSVKSEESDAKFRKWKEDLLARAPVSGGTKPPAWDAQFPKEKRPRQVAAPRLFSAPPITAGTTAEEFRDIVRFLTAEAIRDIMRDASKKRKDPNGS